MSATLESDGKAKAWSDVAELVDRAREGDRDALGELLTQFERTVYAIALNRLGNPSEALELTQEVFLHVMNRLDQIRDPERFAGWLRQVTVRMAINRATRRTPPPQAEDAWLDALSATRSEPVDELVERERAQLLWEGMNRLRPMDREALVAFYIEGQSLLEISEAFSAPVGTIKRRLHVARQRLKAELGHSWTDDDTDLEVGESFDGFGVESGCELAMCGAA